MPKLKWCGVLAGALLLTQITVGAVVAQTSAPVVVWQRYDVDISVQSDGSLEIAQIQTISFRGTLQHGFRVVPLERTTGITSVTVAERVDGREQLYATGSNRPFTFTTSREPDGFGIDWWFTPATNATRTFILRYTAEDAIRQYSSGDQRQWKAIYADRAGPVQAGSVTVIARRPPVGVGADHPCGRGGVSRLR